MFVDVLKRLFFLLAERHDHAWLARLDRDAISLGEWASGRVQAQPCPRRQAPSQVSDHHPGRLLMAVAETCERQVALLIRVMPMVMAVRGH